MVHFIPAVMLLGIVYAWITRVDHRALLGFHILLCTVILLKCKRQQAPTWHWVICIINATVLNQSMLPKLALINFLRSRIFGCSLQKQNASLPLQFKLMVRPMSPLGIPVSFILEWSSVEERTICLHGLSCQLMLLLVMLILFPCLYKRSKGCEVEAIKSVLVYMPFFSILEPITFGVAISFWKMTLLLSHSHM